MTGSGSGSDANGGADTSKPRAQTAFPLGRDGWHKPFTLGGRCTDSNSSSGGANVAKIAFGARRGSAALLSAYAGGRAGGVVHDANEQVEMIVAAEEADDLVLADSGSGSDDELSSRLYGSYHDGDQYCEQISSGGGGGGGGGSGGGGDSGGGGVQHKQDQLWSENHIEGEVSKLVNQALLERDRVAIAALTTQREEMEFVRQSVRLVMRSTTDGSMAVPAALAAAANMAVGQSVHVELEQLRAEHNRLQQAQQDQAQQQRANSGDGGGQDLNASMERHLVEISEQIGVIEVR